MTIKEVGLTYRDTGLKYHKDTLTCPQDVVEYMDGAFDERPDQEQFWVILLNRKNRPLGRFLCTIGTVSSAPIHPREVFKPAILNSASSVIVAHNHPSGDPMPSAQDTRVTEILQKAGRTLGIELVDHIIIGHPEHDPEGIGFHSYFHQ